MQLPFRAVRNAMHGGTLAKANAPPASVPAQRQEVLDAPDQNYWMATAYRIPDTPLASVKPEETGFKTVPINRMLPRSFFTNVRCDNTVKSGATMPIRGIALGGDCGVAKVEPSDDGGETWRSTSLGTTRANTAFASGARRSTRRNPESSYCRRVAPIRRVRCSRANRIGTAAASCAA